MNRRALLLAALGVAFVVTPRGWVSGLLPGLFPANARCHNCRKDLRVGTGTVQCGGCKHVFSADSARSLFNATPGIPRLEFLTERFDGPTPPDVTVVYPRGE